MSVKNQAGRIELISLLAQASKHMHASLDISSIMRVAVTTSMQLIDAKAGAAGLFIEDQLAFSECSDGNSWLPMQCRFGADGWLAELITEQNPIVLTKGDKKPEFNIESSSTIATFDSLIAIPVIGEGAELLACLVLFDPCRKDVKQDLEQLALMMSSAIESSIRYSESRRVEADLQKSIATYRTLVEQIPAITYIASLDRGQVLFVSPQVEDMLGYSQADFLANQEIWMQQIHPDDRGRVLDEVRQSVKNEVPFHSEYRICTKKGNYLWVKDAADVVRESGEELYLQGVLYDIHERKETEKEMIRLAHFDQLTGLANRALFLDRLSQTIAQAKRHEQRFAVLFLDLDGFKAVNDTLGHLAGDKLLIEIAKRLKSQVREEDTVARMGGDEFTIILNEISSLDHIRSIANKLIKAVANPYDQEGKQCKVTISIGISLYPGDSMEGNELITLADNAMYESKKGGKNCCRFFNGEA